MNILYVYADSQREWNCSEWRCAVPMRAINSYTSGSYGEQVHKSDMLFMQAFAEGSDEAKEKVEASDIVVVQRLALANIIPRMLQAEADGKVVVVDLDDAYHYMPDTVRAYKFWHEGEVVVEDEKGQPKQVKMPYPPIEQLEWGVKLSHGVTTPSPQIAKDWKKWNKNTWVVPNYIAGEHYLPFKKNRANSKLTDTINIGWGGSHSHFDSWKKSNIVEALRKVCIDDKRVRVHIFGGNIEVPKLFKDASGVFAGRMFEHRWVPHNEWPRELATLDIGLIPLVGRYDARRSWIKSLEYTLMGIPWIGTKAPPTDELAEYGYQTANSVDAWANNIKHVIDNYDEALNKVNAGFEVANKANANRHTQELLNTYIEIYRSVKGETN